MRKAFILIGVIVAVALTGWYWTTTPQYAVMKIHSAIKNHDLESFQKYADVNAVAGKMVDDLLTKPVQAALGPGIVSQLLGFGLGIFIKPALVASMKDDITDFVTGSNNSPTSYADDGTKTVSTGTFKSIPSKLGFNGKVYRGMDYVRSEGKICLVGLKLHNQKYDTDLILELKLSQADGYWRLIELSNLQEFMSKLVELQGQSPKETALLL